ncbi:hypothetical protein VTK26DRAFT_7462 [Humicola hyalothermophila]
MTLAQAGNRQPQAAQQNRTHRAGNSKSSNIPTPSLPATQPAPPKPAASRPSASKPSASKSSASKSTAPQGAASAAAAPAAAPAASGQPSRAASTAPRQGTCVIGNQTFTATYSREHKRFQATYKGAARLIEYDGKKRKYFIDDGGKTVYRWGW